MKQHIMLVDEDQERLKTVTGRVNEVGVCKCTWAKNAEHALQMLQYLDPDIIVYHVEDGVRDALLQAVTEKGIRLMSYTDADSFCYQ